MVRIAIVEDDQGCAKLLKEYLARYEKESGECIQCILFEDGEDIAVGYRAQYDIILMDIEMQFMDGMSAVETIRKVDEEVTIIFITNMAQYAIRGYSVNALDYILKPVSYFAFSQRIDRAISRLKKKEKHYIVIEVKGGSKKVVSNDIYYLEKRVLADGDALQVSARELASAVLICAVAFALSNLSFVYENTPFSSRFETEIFNIRTLMDLAGFAILYAYHALLHEFHLRYERDTMENMLQNQLMQY